MSTLKRRENKHEGVFSAGRREAALSRKQMACAKVKLERGKGGEKIRRGRRKIKKGEVEERRKGGRDEGKDIKEKKEKDERKEKGEKKERGRGK